MDEDGLDDDGEEVEDAEDRVVDGDAVSVTIDLTWLTTEYASDRKAPKPPEVED